MRCAKVQFAEKQWESILGRPKKQENKRCRGSRSKVADEPVSRILKTGIENTQVVGFQ